MTVKVAINGYGRIGRNILRALYEAKRTGEISIVAINDLGDAKTNAHLTQYDTAHGKFPGTVTVDGDHMVVNGDTSGWWRCATPPSCSGRNSRRRGAECTGLFTSKERPRRTYGRREEGDHLRPGQQGRRRHRRLPCQSRCAEGRRYRHLQRLVHHQLPRAARQAAAQQVGVVQGLMTTIHAYTNDRC